ncbi:hypothetical protein FB451DRAFT_1426359 [Mycena latifolia]|nr:hypothetical protein FB451DRAFT_1426359 [Mycena latifolia]
MTDNSSTFHAQIRRSAQVGPPLDGVVKLDHTGGRQEDFFNEAVAYADTLSFQTCLGGKVIFCTVTEYCGEPVKNLLYSAALNSSVEKQSLPFRPHSPSQPIIRLSFSDTSSLSSSHHHHASPSLFLQGLSGPHHLSTLILYHVVSPVNNTTQSRARTYKLRGATGQRHASRRVFDASDRLIKFPRLPRTPTLPAE